MIVYLGPDGQPREAEICSMLDHEIARDVNLNGLEYEIRMGADSSWISAPELGPGESMRLYLNLCDLIQG